MDFVRTEFRDHDPDEPIGPDDTALVAAEFANMNAGIEEGITKAESALARLDAPRVLSNFKASNTVKLRAAMARAIRVTGIATHVVIGDSLSSASNANGGFTFVNSWWRRAWRQLIATGIPTAGTGRVAVTDVGGVDPRITRTGSWDTSQVNSISSTGPATATFAADAPGQTVDVFYSDHGESFTVTVDGGAPQTVTTGNTWTLKTFSISGLSDTNHSVVVTASGAGVMIFGFQVRRPTGVRFDNLCVKSGQSAYWADQDPNWTSNAALAQAYSADADVLHLALGANDIVIDGDPPYSGGGVEGCVTGLTNLRNRWPNADAILYIEPELADVTNHAAYVAAIRQLSKTLDCPLIDLSVRYGPQAMMSAANIIGNDTLHLNSAGQSDWAAVAFDAIQSVGPRYIA